jgi:hypothetical protein
MGPGALSAAELLAVTSLWKRTGRTVEARFTGASMEPAIPSGARLRLTCGTPVAPGDVAAFVHDGHLLVHRVLDVAPPQMLTRGDALVVPDPPIPLENVFARVEAIEDGGEWRAPGRHRDSAAQRVVRLLCAFDLSAAWARAAVATLRRLRPRRASPVELLE